MSRVSCTSRSRSASASGRSTYTREQAEHFCPDSPNAEAQNAQRRAHVAMSADDGGVLAAHLGDAGLGVAACGTGAQHLHATACEPVKVMPATSGCCASARPVVSPPVTKLITPGGKPASRRHSSSSQPESDVCGEHLTTAVLPVISAGPSGPPASAKGS